MELLKTYLSKYTLYGLLFVSIGLGISTYTFYKISSHNAAQLVLEVDKSNRLKDELTASKKFGESLIANIKERDEKLEEATRKAKQSQKALNEALEKHKEWSDSTVPDDIANGLRERLR